MTKGAAIALLVGIAIGKLIADSKALEDCANHGRTQMAGGETIACDVLPATKESNGE